MKNYTFKVFPAQAKPEPETKEKIEHKNKEKIEHTEQAEDVVAVPPTMYCPPTVPCPPLEPGLLDPLCPLTPCPPLAPGTSPYAPVETGPQPYGPSGPGASPFGGIAPVPPCPSTGPQPFCPPMGPGTAPYGPQAPGLPFGAYGPGQHEMGCPQCPAAPPFTCPYFRLAHAYVPWQFFNVTYSPAEGHSKGTIFPELYMPQGQYGPCEGPKPCRLAFGGGVPCGD